MLILVSLFVVIGIVSTGLCFETRSKVCNNYNTQPNKLVLKLNNSNIILTADLDNELHAYNNFKLKIGNQEKNFKWISIGNISFPPTIKLIDLGSNKSGGVVVVLVESEGTGNYVQKIHAFEIDNFKEITVEDPLKLIQMHVKTQNIGSNIIINIDDTRIELNKEYLEKLGINNSMGKLVFDNHIVYGVKNNNLIVEVGVSNENLTYFGNINIEYIYLDGMLKMKNIHFEKFQ